MLIRFLEIYPGIAFVKKDIFSNTKLLKTYHNNLFYKNMHLKNPAYLLSIFI